MSHLGKHCTQSPRLSLIPLYHHHPLSSSFLRPVFPSLLVSSRSLFPTPLTSPLPVCLCQGPGPLSIRPPPCLPSLLSLTPYLSEQFHGCINQVQTIRPESVPVLPSTSWFMARYAPLSVSAAIAPLFHCRVCLVVYKHTCAFVSATAL